MLARRNKRKGRSARAASFGAPESPTIAHRRLRLQRVFVVSAFITLVVATTDVPDFRDPTGRYEIEDEAYPSNPVMAEFPFDNVDLEATRQKLEQAAQAVPLRYSVDTERVRNQRVTLEQRIITLEGRGDEIVEAIRRHLMASTSADTEEEVVRAALTEIAGVWKEDPLFQSYPEPALLAVWLKPRSTSLPQRVFEEAAVRPPPPSSESPPPDPGLQPLAKVVSLTEAENPALEFANVEPLKTLALEGLEYVLLKGVRQRSNTVQEEGKVSPRAQIIRAQVVRDLTLGEEVDIEDIPVPESALLALSSTIEKLADEFKAESAETSVDWERLPEAAFEMAKSLVTDTLSYNEVSTEAARATARAGAELEPVTKTIERNQVIQRDGDLWTEQSRLDALKYWEIQGSGSTSTRNLLGPLAANAILVGLLLAVLLRAMPAFVSRNDDGYKAVNVALLIISATIVISRAFSFFEPSGLMVPVTASIILLAILTNVRLAAVAGLLMATLLSIQHDHDWQLLVIAGAMGFMGISSLYVVRRRGDIASACIKATVVGLLVFVAISLATGSLISEATFDAATKIALNGAVCLFIVPGLLSPLERLFGITTDIQLLEYSDLNNEILSRLALEVPATYAHSLMMGQLAEAAADTVGANGLLARVCAYYHDIGKLKRPEYFTENQTGYNVHDDLSPRLSARAIASHVTEGVEIAREYHLPKPIIDGIREHHGTLLISFFYQQALDQQKHGDVREEDFRYSGPKPRCRETAILMVCDAVESGIRSIRNPNEERVREFIDKIIRSRSEDRQFDECDITLKELDIVGEVLAKHISTSLHTRISYPERPAKERAENVIPLSGGWE